MDFTGANVADVTKIRQSDVFKKVGQTVVGMVSVSQSIIDANDAMPMATLVTSTDGGLTWNALTTPAYAAGSYAVGDVVYFEGHIFTNDTVTNTAIPTDPSWTDDGVWNANGVLYNDLTESKKTTVVVTGDVIEKHLGGYDSFLRTTLFQNKIIVK